MNELITVYLKKNTIILLYSFIFSIILIYSSHLFIIFYMGSIISYYLLYYIVPLDNKEQEHIKEDITSYFIKIKNKYNIQNTTLHTTNNPVGEVIYKRKHNEIYIPENTIDNIQESKAIIAHEIGHIYNIHKTKYLVCRYIILFISTLVLYKVILINSPIFVLLTILFILTIPQGILNYINHKFEYEADEFATQNISTNVFSKRIRRNVTCNNNKIPDIFPYISSHPSVDDRVKKIHNFN